LSLSASLIIEAEDAHESSAVDFGAIGALSGLGRLGLLPGTADGISSVRVSDTAAGFQLGALYQPLPGTSIGLSFRSAIIHKLTGSVTYANVPALLAASFTDQSAYAKLPSPADASLGVAQVLGRWTLLGDVEWTQWSRFRNLTAVFANGGSSTSPENWHDAWTVAAGADYRLTDSVTVRGGTAYDESAAPGGSLTPRIPDSSRVWLSGGVTWQATPFLALSGAYSHLFGNDTTVMLIDAGPGTPNFLRGNLDASYHTGVDIVSLQATLKF
jgi:long-chain fatty acid transport protein